MQWISQRIKSNNDSEDKERMGVMNLLERSEKLLKENGARKITGGGDRLGINDISVDEKTRERFLNDLRASRKFLNMLVLIIFFLAMIIVSLMIFLAIRNSQNISVLGWVLGGGAGGFLLILNYLKTLLKETWRLNFLLALLPSLKPSEFLRYLKDFVDAERSQRKK